MKKIISLLFFIICSSTLTFAEKPFKLNQTKECILLGSGVALSGSDLILDNLLNVNKSDFNGEAYERNDVNSFDRKFIHSYDKDLDNISDITLVGAMLSPTVLACTDKEEWLTIAIMYTETLLISNGIKEMIKLCVNRARPYMYANQELYPSDDLKDGDFKNSFLSGHSTMAFAGATFTSYTFSKYFPDSNWKYPVIASSYALAATTSVLRIKAGCHFLSDVICGGALGCGIGFLVPYLHSAKNENVNISLLANGFLVAIKF